MIVDTDVDGVILQLFAPTAQSNACIQSSQVQLTFIQ